jgi:hypothetical protein
MAVERRAGDTPRRGTMDNAPQTGDFIVGESFARILTETT